MFEELSSVFATNDDVKILPKLLNIGILQYLIALENEFKRYF